MKTVLSKIFPLIQFIKFNPNASNTHTNLGDLLFALNRLEEALESYIQSNQINPFNPSIHKSMGVIYYNLGRKEDALREFEVTELLAPYDSEVQSWIMHLNKEKQ